MQIASAADLSRKLRSLADTVRERLWVAVPYVGGWNAVKSLLGLRWRDCDRVRFRLLTDIDNTGWLDKQTIEVMNSYGQIKHLQGLHAKLYIVDDRALVTSANLTERAFSRRYEMGIFLSPRESKLVINTFERWWDDLAKVPRTEWTKALSRSSRKPDIEEPGEDRPRKLYALPLPPPDREWVAAPFRDHKAFRTSYRDLADTYAGLGKRVFRKAPLNIEVDMFLNYLFHHDGKPSEKYAKRKSPRNLTKEQQRVQINKHKRRFKKWIGGEEYDEMGGIQSRLVFSATVSRLLSRDRIKRINWEEVGEVAKALRCMLPINRAKFLNPKNNRLREIKDEWNLLLHGVDVPIEVRMTHCYERLAGFGPSAVQELPGWFDPNKYPIRNSNSNAGLRFLGY